MGSKSIVICFFLFDQKQTAFTFYALPMGGKLLCLGEKKLTSC